MAMDTNRQVAFPLMEVIDQKQAALNAAIEAVEELRANLAQCTQVLDEGEKSLGLYFCW